MFGAFIYAFHRLGQRIGEFLRHWYVRSARMYFNFFLNKLSELDYFFAWKITIRNLFEPLYHDYSFIGRVLGFVFRSVRLAAASVVYAAVFAFALGIYLLWLLVIPALLVAAFAPSLL